MKFKDSSNGSQFVDLISDEMKNALTPETQKTYQDLLLEIYSNINDPDGIYGLNTTHSIEAQIVAYEHEGNVANSIGA